MRLRFLSDQPIETPPDDELGFNGFVDSLRSMLAGSETPFVYGLLGERGSGRTSALRLLETRLRQEREAGASALVPVWLNARQYENEVNQFYPLLYALRQAYQGDRRITALAGARGFGGMFARVAATSALAGTDVALRGATRNLAGEALPLKDLREHLEAVRQQPEHLEGLLRGWAEAVSQLRSGFEALLGTYASDLARADPRLKVEDVRFAILVDDLDHCSPASARAIFENLRQFLAVRRAVFVLALNAPVMARVLAGTLRMPVDDWRQYLEAALNGTVHLPAPAPELVQPFVRQRLARQIEEPDPALSAVLDAGCEAAAQAWSTARLDNPRLLKRLVNRYVIFLERNAAQLDQFSLPNMARLLAIAETEPGLWQAYLADAERMRGDLNNIGTPEFSLAAFEAAHGVAARATFARLLARRTLFELEADGDKLSLQRQVNEVDLLTRW
jgi:KAP family P-loop domain